MKLADELGVCASLILVKCRQARPRVPCATFYGDGEHTGGSDSRPGRVVAHPEVGMVTVARLGR